MPDNVAITAGAGTSIATDLIGSDHYQRVKPTVGADGTATDVSPTAPMPHRPGHPSAKVLTTASVSTSSSGQTALVSATGGQTTRLFSLFLVFEGATTFKIQSASTDLTGAMLMATGATICLDFNGEPYFVTVANEALNISLGSAVGCRGWVQYEKS